MFSFNETAETWELVEEGFVEPEEGIVKLSLRSKGNVRVNDIAKEYFQGGGHINASGGISQVSVNKTITILEKIINNLNN